eukprot:TRINITY_DN97_c0_g1_i1.p1 TRINITY_DN97_c0_g1~~TRINITY_DN97_c0_g1_i1.p1  ORF type:complete len:147 (-),score=26.45 TRINITY_DN97_c0_g1_i1:208-648(-)
MMKEIKVAARWWASQLKKNKHTPKQIKSFEKELQKHLFNKYKGHWYNHDPLKGHAYRSILFDDRNRIVDEVLLESALAAKIPDIVDQLALSCGLIMWVDPGQVSIRLVISPMVQDIYVAPPEESIRAERPSSQTQPHQQPIPTLVY